jgi:hypothetical protein
MNHGKVYWPNVLVDLVVVVLGVTLAFLLNSWYENLQDKKLETRYLQGFYQDIQTDLLALDSIIVFENQTVSQINQAIQGYKKSQPEPDSVLLVLSMISQYNPFNPAQITYESVLNTGHLSVISSLDLRQSLIHYYRSLIEKSMIEQVYMDYISNYVTPLVIEYVDILNQEITDKSYFSSVHFRNILQGCHQLLQQYVEFYVKMRSEGWLILEKLNKNQDSSNDN